MAGQPVSEFGGGGVMPNTVFPKGREALTPADKLRLQSLTGQEVDSNAPVDPFHWMGGVEPPEPTPYPSDAELFNNPERYRETGS
jgi:hypothetical protein